MKRRTVVPPSRHVPYRRAAVWPIRGWLALALCALGPAVRLAANNSLPEPYAQTGWPAQHHDAHNSDWIPVALREFQPAPELPTVRWVLRETNNPTVEMVQASVATLGTQEVLYVTSGKLNWPNLHAYSQDDGREVWHSAPATNATAPGPNSVVLTSSPTVNTNGDLFIADSKYLFCYSSGTNLDAQGNHPYQWRVVLPHLQAWNETLGVWQPSTNAADPSSFAKPFLSLVFSRLVNGKACLGGISIAGDVFFFDPENGDVVAETHLQSPLPPPSTNPPCDPYVLARLDDPMQYDLTGTTVNSDTNMPFGIWCAGPNSDEPDFDYFMNPCQIEMYLAANTAGTGTMVANTPAIIPDPLRPKVSRIYVPAEQSQRSALQDNTPNETDAVVYRVDFDPTLPYTNRLKVMNYQLVGGQPVFDGRMPDGQNSATSPNIAPNQRWLFCADRNGRLYGFDVNDGARVWVREIGTVMGSLTTWQVTDAEGRFKLFSFGGFEMHAFEVDAATGLIATNPATGQEFHRALDFEPHLLTRCWRPGEAYAQTFRSTEGVPFERVAAGASYMIGTSNRLFAVYTLGWHHPQDPSGTWIIPTHSVVLVVNPAAVWTAHDEAGMIEATYLDTNGTCEVTFCPSPDGRARGVIYYGSQSTSFAQFLDQNNLMPDDMKPLYLRPYGGMRIVELPLTNTPNAAPTIALTSPANGSFVVRGATVEIKTHCEDADGRIGAFNLHTNGALMVANSYSGDWQQFWTPETNGTFVLTAEVYDNDGLRAVASSTIVVDDDADGDGLPNAQETALGTHSGLPDSDSDGFADGAEVWAGTSPTAGSSHPTLPPPVFLPPPGTYFHDLLVTLTNSTPGATVRYTTSFNPNGPLPATNAPVMDPASPIVITRHASGTNDPAPGDATSVLTPVSMTILAQAVAAGGGVSMVVTGQYVLNKVESHFNLAVAPPPYEGSTKHQLDIYHPRGLTNNRVVLFIHGGAWKQGDKDMYLELGNTLAGYYGLTTVIANYELSDTNNSAMHPDHIDDVANAFAWTYTNIWRYGGDSNRLFVFGQSAGAHLVSLLATDCHYLEDRQVPCDAIKGVIAMSGAYDLNDFVQTANNPLGMAPLDIAMYQVLCLNTFGSLVETNLAAASPATHVRAGLPPFHLIHAWEDMPGFIQECLDFRDLLAATSNSVTLLRLDETNIPPAVAALDFPFGGHYHEVYAVNTRDWDSLSTRTVVDFVDRLDPPPAAPARLQAEAQAGQLVLRWPILRDSLFLEGTERLDSDGAWQLLFGRLIPTNGCYEVSLPLTGASRFYRLKRH